MRKASDLNALTLATFLLGRIVTSAWSDYGVHTEPVLFAESCGVDLRNTAYSFRPPSIPYGHPITLRGGSFTELNDFTHKPEWTTVLTRQKEIKLGAESARLVILNSDHVGGGPNSPRRLYILACEAGRLVTVLEAVSEVLRYSYSPSMGLRLSYFIWSPHDPHFDPSHEAVEIFEWSVEENQFSLKSRVVIPRPSH